MKTAKVVEFVRACINCVQAGGYQEFERSEIAEPDDYFYDGPVTVLVFGDETFEMVVRKKRKTSDRNASA